MHYRNGREAKNGDKIVKLEGGKIVSFGVLHSAIPGNDYCNGNIAVIQPPNDYACARTASDWTDCSLSMPAEREEHECAARRPLVALGRN
jgi:hypothetical protein